MIQYPKAKPLRDEGYRQLVASLPCAWCGIEGHTQAAHANTGKGMAMKSSDADLIPLCGPRPGVPGCHARLDQGGMLRYERRRFEAQWAEHTRTKMRRMARHDERIREIVARSIGLEGA